MSNSAQPIVMLNGFPHILVDGKLMLYHGKLHRNGEDGKFTANTPAIAVARSVKKLIHKKNKENDNGE